MAQKILNRLYDKDARLISKYIKKPIVDVIITSPPYFDMKDYGVTGQIGYGQNYQAEYLKDIKKIFEDCNKITKTTGSLWLIIDTFKRKGNLIMLPFDVAKILAETGWILQDIIIWDKGKTLPWSHKGNLRNIFEYILFFTKSNEYKYFIENIKEPNDLKRWWIKYPERYSPEGKTPTNIWRIPIPVQGSWSSSKVKHFCPFPEKLVERILLLATNKGDVVLDPFAGSGVVLAQAYSMKRKYIGFEINEKYVNTFHDHVIKEIKSKWKTTGEKHIGSIEKQKKILRDKIIKLRSVKYPFSISREFYKQHKSKNEESMPIICSVAVYEGIEIGKKYFEKDRFIKESVYIIINNEGQKEDIENIIIKIKGKPPISKFGIYGDIKVLTKKQFAAFLNQCPRLRNKGFWLYRGGVNYNYFKKYKFDKKHILEKFDDLKQLKKNGLPPVITNVKIVRNELTEE